MEKMTGILENSESRGTNKCTAKIITFVAVQNEVKFYIFGNLIISI